MALPDILPTGAMASGDYVDYMISYLDSAMDSISDQLGSYMGLSTLDGWDTQWGRTVTDLETAVADISTRVNKIKAQTRMVQDGINRL